MWFRWLDCAYFFAGLLGVGLLFARATRYCQELPGAHLQLCRTCGRWMRHLDRRRLCPGRVGP